MVVVKTIQEFQDKNEEELKAFFTNKTGIFDREMVHDTMQEFYTRLIQSKALEKFDDKLAPNEAENQLNYERWVCNNFCWLLPNLRGKNYRGTLKIKLSKKAIKRRDKFSKISLKKDEGQDPNYETIRFLSIVNTKEDQKDVQKDIFDIINPSLGNSSYSIDESYRVSSMEQEGLEDIKKDLESFIRHIKKTQIPKKAIQLEKYMRYRIEGLNSVDIGGLLGISSNMVKFIRQEAKEKYEKWLKSQEI